MKIKPGFILRTVAGENIAMPTQGVADMDMMITLNDTGRFLWEQLQQEKQSEELVDALLKEYDVDAQTARKAVDSFTAMLKENDFLA